MKDRDVAILLKKAQHKPPKGEPFLDPLKLIYMVQQYERKKLGNQIENNMVIRYTNLENGTIGKEEYCLTFDDWKKIKKRSKHD